MDQFRQHQGPTFKFYSLRDDQMCQAGRKFLANQEIRWVAKKQNIADWNHPNCFAVEILSEFVLNLKCRFVIVDKDNMGNISKFPVKTNILLEMSLSML